jgi:hypothetical protein
VTGELETLARAIHDAYRRRSVAKGSASGDDPSLAQWEDLPETLRESNRHQAADIDRKLAAVSCHARRSDGDEGPPGFRFSPGEVELLAQMEHDRWAEERRSAGWVYGPTKDVETKRSPYLVPWEDLSEEVRDLDRDTVRGIPRFLARLGFVVARRRDPGVIS